MNIGFSKNNSGINWVIFLLIFIAFSCKKESHIPPSIVVNSPYENQMYNGGDTIYVNASISGKNVIGTIRLDLLNENMIPILPMQTFNISGTEHELNAAVIIDILNIESQTAYIQITSYHGDAEGKAFKKVLINAVSKQYLSTWFVSAGVNFYKVFKSENHETPQKVALISGDVATSIISPQNQAFYITGKTYGGFVSVNTNTGNVNWNKPPVINPPAPYYTSLGMDRNSTLVSYYDSKILKHDDGGNTISTIHCPGFIPFKTFAINNLILSEQKSTNSNLRKLVVYFSISGAQKHEILLPMEIVSFCIKDEDNIFVFGNNAGQGIMKIYNISGNYFWEPHTIPPGKVFAAARVDSNNYLISHSNGIYKYQYNPNSLTTFKQGVVCSELHYDDVNSRVFASENNKIHSFLFPLGQSAGTIVHSDSIITFGIQFNKQ